MCPRDEVVEAFEVPSFQALDDVNPNDVDLGPKVVDQLHQFISVLAHSYKQNPFHNFAHASHVAMSAKKLVQRIIASNKGHSQEAVYKETLVLPRIPRPSWLLCLAPSFTIAVCQMELSTRKAHPSPSATTDRKGFVLYLGIIVEVETNGSLSHSETSFQNFFSKQSTAEQIR